MEKIKKTILQVTTTQSVPCPSGVTGPCHIIVPDLSVFYNIKINLTAELMDIGFFDAYVPPPPPPEPPIPPEPPVETFYYVDFEGNDYIEGGGDNYVWQ